ncbi:hypothetical protein GTO10_04460, partial [Candidatus Saccharibacteria bacterium]|nr:hypothetical protein [Candidatus Saccharibacteria bacterium]
MSGITATQKENLLQAALEITCDCGWKVFPVKPREKIPLTEHGCKDATSNERTIVAWGEKWPDANIGVATGQASGIVVLDVDKRHGGDDSLFELEQKHGELPKTVEVITGGGGRHIYFKYPSGDVTVKNAAGLAGIAGLDIRGDGGYVVAPPSV